MSTTFCPVPRNQQPLEEYKELSQSWFFSLAQKSTKTLRLSLLLTWLIVLPFNVLICGSSFSLRNDVARLIIYSMVMSFSVPILVLVRQLISWDYIRRRLNSKEVEYEETGWQDGNSWKKPETWLQKDMLIAQHEVKPIIQSLINPLITSIILMIVGLIFSQLLVDI